MYCYFTNISIFLLIFYSTLVSSLDICNGCLDSQCGFGCNGRQCQAYSFTPACANQGCVGGYCCISSYYISYSTQTNNYTYCVACNYTYPGCVGCSYQDYCTQCQPQYILKGGQCYNPNGTPVGYVPVAQATWIAFVVLFAVFALYFAIIAFLKYRNSINKLPPIPESPRRNTELVQS